LLEHDGVGADSGCKAIKKLVTTKAGSLKKVIPATG